MISRKILAVSTAIALAISLLEAASNYRERDLSGAAMAGANLENADFTDSNLDRANLSGANLRAATGERSLFRGARLDNAILDDATFPNGQFQQIQAPGSSFQRANLRGASFAAANLAGADFSKANLADADFRGARIDGANFDGAKLGSALFDAPPAVRKGKPVPQPMPQEARKARKTTLPQPAPDFVAPVPTPSSSPDVGPEPKERRSVMSTVGRVLWPFGGRDEELKPSEPAAKPSPTPRAAQPAAAPAPAPTPAPANEASPKPSPEPKERRSFIGNVGHVLWPFGGGDDEPGVPATTTSAHPAPAAPAPSPAPAAPAPEPRKLGDARIDVAVFAIDQHNQPVRTLRIELFDVERDKVVDADRTDRDGTVRFEEQVGRKYQVRPAPDKDETLTLLPPLIEFNLAPEGAKAKFGVRFNTAPPAP